MLTAFGATNALSSILAGHVLQIIKLRTLLRFMILAESAIWLTLLIWTPTPCCNELPYYALSTGFGLIFGVMKSQTSNIFNSFFERSDLAPAMGILGACEAISICTIYMLGAFPAKYKIVLVLACSLFGTLCYEYAYKLHNHTDKKKRRWT